MAVTNKTDVARLWEQAFIEYNQTVGEKGLKIDLIQLKLVSSVQDVTRCVDDASKAFKKYRHDDSTLDKVRSFIGDKLSYVQVVGDKVTESASASFPPACAIWTVCTYAIKTCQTMSQDYNQLLALIGEAGNFLKTLEIMEENIPDCKRYTECVTETLIAIVGVFAVQTKFMLMKRPMAFLHTLVRGGGDTDLEKAYSRVTEALSRLSRANEIMTIKNTQDIKEMVGRWGVKMEFYHEDIISELQKQSDGIQDNHRAILENQVGIEANQQGIEANRRILEQIQLRLIRSEEGGAAKEDSSAQEAATNVSAALIKAKRFFEAKADPETKLKELSKSFVAGSTDWLFNDAVYRSWLDGDEAFLWLTADPGQGKSHVAFSLIEKLKRECQSRTGTSVAYFFFEEESETYSSSKNALCSIGLQIAKQDRKYREKIASKGDNQGCETKSFSEVWRDALVLMHFDKDQKNQLILVLDGFDCAASGEQAAMLENLSSVPTKGLRIKVFFTGKSTIHVDGCNLLRVENRAEETKVKMLESRLEALPRVSRFRPFAKRKITQRLMDKSFSLLYVERFLKTLEAKALERPALLALKSPPAGLSALYEQLFLKCFDGRNAEEAEALRFVFSWLGVCMRVLTLQEINALMVLKFGKKVLDIEDEIAGRCASILEIASSVTAEEENKLLQKEMVKIQLSTSIAATKTSMNAEDAAQDRAKSDLHLESQAPPLPTVAEDDGSFLVYFQDTTMKRFIRHESNEQISWTSFTAHLHAFATCAEVLGRLEDTKDSSEPNTVLHNYAAFAWIKHLLMLDKYDEASDEDASLISHRLIDIYGASAVPSMNIFQQTDVSYDDFIDRGAEFVQKWLKRGLETKGVVADSNVKCLSEMLVEQPNLYLTTLARNQARHWIYQVTWEAAEKALMTALKAYQTKEGKRFDQNMLSKSDIQDLVMGLDPRLVPFDYRFHRAMAMSWQKLSGTFDPYAYDNLDTEKFFTLYHLAVALSQTGKYDKACRCYKQALELKRFESPEERETTRVILLALGAQEKDGMKSVELLERALAAAPDTSGICFTLLLVSLSKQRQYGRVVETVTRYGSLRLTLVVPGDYVNDEFQKSAKLAGMTEAMVATYKQLINDQDPLKWASPARFFLARAYRRIVGNNSKAKELLYQILDSDTCIHPANGLEDDSLLYRAQMALSEILYEQFVSSSSLTNKAGLLQEMSSLQNRQLGQDLSVDNESGSYNTSLARMCQKLDSLSRFYEILDGDFRNCMDKLQDDDPWNDSATLRQLCKILACLPEFEEEAAITMCASFYIIDPGVLERLNVNEDHFVVPSEGSENEEDSGRYDTAQLLIECSGCGNNEGWSGLRRRLYKCTICAECTLCEECHAQLQSAKAEKNDAIDPDPYCGANHSYITVPIPGWLGIKKGKMLIEGREPVVFNEWLKQLREEKWEQIWEKRFLG